MNTSTRTMIVFGLSTCFAGTASHPSSAQEKEGKMLLTFVNVDEIAMTQKQKNILNRIEKAPQTMNSSVVKLQPEALEKTGHALQIPVDRQTCLNLGTSAVEKMPGGSSKINWKGFDKKDSVNLVVSGNSAHGLIYVGDNVYSLEALGDGLHALSRLDQTKFKER